MAHDPFKQLEFTAHEREASETKPPSDYPKHVNYPDGSYKVARNAEEEAQYLAEIPGAPKAKRGLLARLGL